MCPRAPKMNQTRVTTTKSKGVPRAGIFRVHQPLLLNARHPARPRVRQGGDGRSPVPSPLPGDTTKHNFPSCLCLAGEGGHWTSSSQWNTGGSDVTLPPPLSSCASLDAGNLVRDSRVRSMASDHLNHLTESQLGTLLDCDADSN